MKTQSAEAVAAVLKKAQEKVPPVVEPPAVGTTPQGTPTTTRNVSTVARLLLVNGSTNAEVFAELQREFNLPASRRGYPAWYRSQLTRQGVLTGSLATTTNGKGKAMLVTSKRPMTIEEQVEQLGATLTSIRGEISGLKAKRVGLNAAHVGYCQSMKLKTEEEKSTSPVLTQLNALDTQLASLHEQLTLVTTQHTGMKAAAEAYAKAMKDADKSVKVVAPTKATAVKAPARTKPTVVKSLKDLGPALAPAAESAAS
jgi:hypothetical protein